MEERLAEAGRSERLHLTQMLPGKGGDVVKGGPKAKCSRKFQEKADGEVGKIGLQRIEGKDAFLSDLSSSLV